MNWLKGVSLVSWAEGAAVNWLKDVSLVSEEDVG